MPNLYIGNINNNPTKIKKMYIGDNNNNPIKLKKIWIGDKNNNPKLIFSEGVPDGYIYDFDASFNQYNQSEVGSIINAVNRVPYQIQPWHLIIPSSTVWGLGQVSGRPISFNNQNTVCGRGGTFRLPNPVDNATLVLVQRLDSDMLPGNDSFTNCCYFNEIGSYIYQSDYFMYTSEEIARLQFRENYGSIGVGKDAEHLHPALNKHLCIVWFYTEDSQVKIKIKSLDEGEAIYTSNRTSSKKIQDIRVCDWAGGGVQALTGELYEFIIWPRSLSEEEKLDAENFLFEKWK